MRNIFVLGWMYYLDESMSIWGRKWMFPGWNFPPPKPHPYVNGYHYIADGAYGTLYSIDIVEGKDLPPRLG